MSAAARNLSASGLRVGYGRQVVAEIAELHLAPGMVWLVTGPNGSGKTTLLKTLAGLLRPVSGFITPPGSKRPSYSSARTWSRGRSTFTSSPHSL